MKEIIFDRHARRRMKWRKISEDDVKFVLDSPEKTEITINERINIFRWKDNRYLKVTYKDFETYLLIISAVDKND